MTDDVAYEFADAVSTISLRRPERHNAMTPGMWRAVADGVRRADEDGARAVVLTAEGTLFCSGDDIGSLAAVSLSLIVGLIALPARSVRLIEQLSPDTVTKRVGDTKSAQYDRLFHMILYLKNGILTEPHLLICLVAKSISMRNGCGEV